MIAGFLITATMMILMKIFYKLKEGRIMLYITLAEQAERLADELFAIAVLSLESPQYGNFTKVCDTLEDAIRRRERRYQKADLVF